MKNCPSCNTPNEDGAAFCDNCGNALGAAGPVVPVAPAAPVYPPTPGPAPVGGGVNCPQCGTLNLPGTMYCDNCGSALSGVPPTPGPIPAGTPPAGFPLPAPAPVGQAGVAPGFPMPSVGAPPPPVPARLVVGGQQIVVPQKAEAIVGRADIASGWNPDVDLTPAGGTPDAGVSRKHAKLVWLGTGWAIEDMNSVNGTYLRGQRLAPSLRTPLSTGDMIQLGKLQLTFYAQ